MIPASLDAAPTRRWLIVALLFLGLALRSYHYLRDRAVWQDEAGLLLTVSAREYQDLFLGRLDYHQAAPPLYLCVLKTVSLFLGDSSRALRLPSYLASCAALLLFMFVARRFLTRMALPWAFLLFAVSEQLLWHASEAKAYSVDVLAAVLVLALPCCRRLQSVWRQLLGYTLLMPLLLLSSYPACFLGVGVLLAYLPAVWGRKHGATWLTYGMLTATTATLLLWLVFGPVRCQHDAEIHSCWIACMPDWQRPWTIPGWLLLSPLEVCRYCCKPLGQVLALFAVAGTRERWRIGERTMVRLMLFPIVLTLGAACLHVYPFGGARIMAYASPAILLLTAAGVPPLLAWLRSATGPKPQPGLRSLLRMGRRIVWAGLLVALLLPLITSLVKVIHPWSEANLAVVADYVEAQRRGGDLILGNDVAQQYYFRHAGPAFHLLDESPLPTPTGGRVWVLMTAALPQSERKQLASCLAPVGWRLQHQHDFPFTTILLFSR